MIILKSVVVWLTFILVESLNGTVRILWLVPQLGEELAHSLSFAIGSLLIVTLATLFGPWLKASLLQQFMIGLLWLSLTLAFEIGLGRFVFHYSWARIWADYDLSQGGLMAIGLLLMLVSPWIGHQLRSGLVVLDSQRGQ